MQCSGKGFQIIPNMVRMSIKKNRHNAWSSLISNCQFTIAKSEPQSRIVDTHRIQIKTRLQRLGACRYWGRPIQLEFYSDSRIFHR
jgi:hypothetical protein